MHGFPMIISGAARAAGRVMTVALALAPPARAEPPAPDAAVTYAGPWWGVVAPRFRSPHGHRTWVRFRCLARGGWRYDCMLSAISVPRLEIASAANQALIHNLYLPGLPAALDQPGALVTIQVNYEENTAGVMDARVTMATGEALPPSPGPPPPAPPPRPDLDGVPPVATPPPPEPPPIAAPPALAPDHDRPYISSPPPPPPAPPRPTVVTNPDWIRKPSAKDFARAYPKRAARLEINGSAIISCRITAKGTLTACVVVSEEPVDCGFGVEPAACGFGEAALKVAPLFRMKPTTPDGVPTAGRTIRIPMRFRIG